MIRKKFDAYYTPDLLVYSLLKRIKFEGSIYECCNGQGHISEVLKKSGFEVNTNDIDPGVYSDTNLDARSDEAWASKPDWTITNPPFSDAVEILKKAFTNSSKGVAFLLRLSFLEPCSNRADWLEKNPPSHVFVLPRISFTGDGGKDTVTVMWCVWEHEAIRQGKQVIQVITKEELKSFIVGKD